MVQQPEPCQKSPLALMNVQCVIEHDVHMLNCNIHQCMPYAAMLIQVNEFLKLLTHSGALEMWGSQQLDGHQGPNSSGPQTSIAEQAKPALQILDCGCGSAALTLCTYHYLNDVLGVPAQLTGVDTNAQLMAKSAALAQELGIPDAQFITSSIADHQPAMQPDIVLALHACDIATDQALALGVTSGAGLIMSVPCCHKDLHKQLQARPPFEPVMRHGIMRQRFADLLTDSLRAALLRVVGYKTDVVEFVSTEHTPRNLLIRAVRTPQVCSSSSSSSSSSPHEAEGGEGKKELVSDATEGSSAQACREYVALKQFWSVTPHLEVLLADQVVPLLGKYAPEA